MKAKPLGTTFDPPLPRLLLFWLCYLVLERDFVLCVDTGVVKKPAGGFDMRAHSAAGEGRGVVTQPIYSSHVVHFGHWKAAHERKPCSTVRL